MLVARIQHRPDVVSGAQVADRRGHPVRLVADAHHQLANAEAAKYLDMALQQRFPAELEQDFRREILALPEPCAHAGGKHYGLHGIMRPPSQPATAPRRPDNRGKSWLLQTHTQGSK